MDSLVYVLQVPFSSSQSSDTIEDPNKPLVEIGPNVNDEDHDEQNGPARESANTTGNPLLVK